MWNGPSGLSTDGLDMLLIWPLKRTNQRDEVLRSHLSSGDLESAEALKEMHPLLALPKSSCRVWRAQTQNHGTPFWRRWRRRQIEPLEVALLARDEYDPSFGDMPIKYVFLSHPTVKLDQTNFFRQINAVAKSKGIEWPAIRGSASLPRDAVEFPRAKSMILSRPAQRVHNQQPWERSRKTQDRWARPSRSQRLLV